jgi:hypothetical protein
MSVTSSNAVRYVLRIRKLSLLIVTDRFRNPGLPILVAAGEK